MCTAAFLFYHPQLHKNRKKDNEKQIFTMIVYANFIQLPFFESRCLWIHPAFTVLVVVGIFSCIKEVLPG